MPWRAERVVLLLVLVFCSIQLLLVWDGGVNGVFNSPDENTNYHFAVRVFEGAPFKAPSLGDGSPASDFLFTRSTRLIARSLVPTSFIGFTLFTGLLSKALFANIIPMVTIFFSGAGLYAFFVLLRRIFDRQIACLATFLLAIHPAWWYYTNASLFPNILFVSLLLICFAALLNDRCTSGIRDSAALVCLTMSLLVRTSEVLWVLPALMIFIWLNKNAVRWQSLAWSAAPSVVILILFFGFARELIGTTTGFGYVIGAGETSPLTLFTRYLLPFGFHPKLILHSVWNFAVLLFAPFTILALVGFYAVIRKKNAAANAFLIIWLAISIVLFIFYGSWDVRDTVSALEVTIGTSFVRYFLPYYVLSAPVMAFGIRFIAERFRARSYAGPASVVILALLVYGSVVFGIYSNESVLAKLHAVRRYDTTATWVKENTEPDSIVVTRYGDKYVWPSRAVITALDHPKVLDSIGYFVRESGRSVYLLSVTLDDASLALFQSRLQPVSVALADPIFASADVSIYPIIKISP
ncbi:MAG: hypothetical protein AAB490_02245 [Patescibacteria group bacterium]